MIARGVVWGRLAVRDPQPRPKFANFGTGLTLKASTRYRLRAPAGNDGDSAAVSESGGIFAMARRPSAMRAVGET